jgi:cobalt-zinc-cadmium efflux system membrane fusion protein
MRNTTFGIQLHRRLTLLISVTALALTVAVADIHALLHTAAAAAASSASNAPAAAHGADTDTVQLTDSQLASIPTGPVPDRDFAVQKDAVGNIDFNEDMNVQVFTPYQGRIIQTYGDLGDEVRKGQTLFTIESPDFIAAQSSLISAAGALEQTNSALERARKLYAVQGIDQNDYESAVANQQSAEGALRAARDAVAIFGKTESEIDHIVASRAVETALIVRSPISGRITARNAAPGLLEQPGNAPAPFAVADLSTMWMLANVPEADIPAYHVGEELRVEVTAYPGRSFRGKVTALGESVDPNTRRVTLRSTIRDPEHALRSGMFASFVIQVGVPVHAPAMPLNGVVREGDGTMSVWVVQSDRHQFKRRVVKLGMQQDGFDEILDGLRPGETVALDGAILLSNMAFGGAT